MSSHNTPASNPASLTLAQRFTRRPRRRTLLLGWAILAALGWLGYLPFVGGAVPGVHGLAWVYGKLFAIALLTLLAVIILLGAGSLAVCLLLLSLKLEWRQSIRRGLAKVGLLLAVGIFLLVALLPALLVGYAPQASQTMSPWGVTYRTVYVAFPLDDNYGELMLLSCRSPGLCHQIYRSSTDIISAGGADLAFNTDTNQVALNLEGQWVYVRSPDKALCNQPLPPTTFSSSCSFVPSE
ncbi:hypothetical protein [Phormidium tenue]|uniref:Uncharacterized protein n=1 Tax=Phormidium tenue NIES-30 TaxID=549789 RepID=A0A1U7J191_9CYAN|nr:hypothetical protein [Phormidium tenue]MBD2233845.1 hypothetical protein [Phormidium tenue FACHB-1052]OKH45642.1 hypothetical protein NIES30_19125 [Phormidium tenue NIES-30]